MNPSSSQDALNQLTAYRSGIKDPNTILAEQRAKYGVDNINQRIGNLRSSIVNTEGLLNGVDNSVTGRTSGTLTTEAARSKLVNLERQPISETLATQQSGLSNEQQNLGTAVNDASTGAQLAYGGQQDQLTYLKSIYDTLFAREQAQAEAARLEQERQDKLRSDAAQLALSKLGLGNDNATPADPNAAPTDPLAQIAYNDVKSRVFGTDKSPAQTDAQLKTDYNATSYSAGYGNAKDKLKLQYYKTYRPDLFGNYSVPNPAAKSTPKSHNILTDQGAKNIHDAIINIPNSKQAQAVKSYVTKPGTGNLSTGNAQNNLKQWFGWLPWGGQ